MTERLKTKKCAHCGGEFVPKRPMQAVCSVECATGHARSRRERAVSKKKQKAMATHRVELKARREALKRPSDHAREAQSAFNRFIRMRDWGKPCISCDRLHGRDHQRHASHYRSVKAAKQLRYNCWNVHTSCAQCNTMESGNILEYRIRLILKIGQERVEALEHNNALCAHDVEYYKRVKRIFSKRANHYKRIRGV